MGVEGRVSALPAPIRLGFVGGAEPSFIGRVHRAAAALSGRYATVAACLSSDPSRARAAAAGLGIAPERAYDGFAAMAATEGARPDGLEAVAILTPNGGHHAVAAAFLDAGVHVICEKPVVTRLADGLDLAARRRGRVFAVAHAYTGYGMVQEARARVQAGELGTIRIVQVEYAQGWLATALEREGHALAARRTDPRSNGAAGCVAAIGSHAFNLAAFVTGLRAREAAADLVAFVPGRAVPDNAHIMLRYEGGARGQMWISQVAPGHDNALRLRVYGERGSLEWAQTDPNRLVLRGTGEPGRDLAEGGRYALSPGRSPLRLPAGHPQGFVEAFANLYRDAAEQIAAQREGRACDPLALWVPTLHDGLDAVAFAEAALASSDRNGAWTAIAAVARP